MNRLPKMCVAAGVLALLLGSAGVARAGGEQPKSDKDLLQGAWTVESAKKGGEEAPKELIDSMKMTIKGDKVTLNIGNEMKDGTFKVDSSKKPKHIDITIDDKNIEAIYELKGPALTIIAAEPGTARPTDIKKTDADATMVIVFKRVPEAKEEKKKEEKKAPVQVRVRGAAALALPQQDKAQPGKEGKEGKSDQDKVQGDWLVESIEKGGEKIPEELTKSIKVNIKGNKISIMFGGESKDGTFKVDETKKPKEIDLSIDGKDSLAIYQFEGEKLKICGSEPGQERPKKFDAADTMTFVFKRAPAAKEDKEKDKDKDKEKKDGAKDGPGRSAATQSLVEQARKSDRDLLQGEWTCVAAERAGEKVPADFIKSWRFTFKDDNVTVLLGRESKAGPYQLDAAKSPPQITMKIEGEGKNAVGIYKLEGDQLTVSVAAEDQGRPAGFVTAQGQRHAVLVFKRSEAIAKANAAVLQEGAKRQQSANNLKQIGLAFHSYHDAMRSFPAAAINDKDGKPLLSWRVALLPYLEQNQLYQQFKLDEPWDSPNNMKLLSKMPAVFGEAQDGKYETFYQVFNGPGAVFDGIKGLRLQNIQDGTSNTALVIEAGKSVPWTKPDDIPFDAKKELPKFGGLFGGNFHLLLADGSVRYYVGAVDAEMMRRVIQRADGMIVDLEKLTK